MKTITVKEFNDKVKATQPFYVFYLSNEPYSRRQVGYVTYNEVDEKIVKAAFGKSKLIAMDKFINNKFGSSK